MLSKNLLGLVAASAFVLPLSAHAAAGFVNGSFEDGVDPGSSFVTLGAGSTGITGWNIGDAGVDYIGGYWQASDGNRSIDLSALNAGSVWQTLTGLTVGQTYAVLFDLAGNPDGGASTKIAVASEGGVQSEVFSFPMGGATKSNMGWTPESFVFTASSSTVDVKFMSGESNPHGPALDNVRLKALGVPEPATWAMMIAGFGLMGATLRSRRTVLA